MSKHEIPAVVALKAANVAICRGEYCRGGNEKTQKDIEDKLGDLSELVTFLSVSCLNNCNYGPNVQVGGTIFERVGRKWTGTKIPTVVEAIKADLPIADV